MNDMKKLSQKITRNVLLLCSMLLLAAALTGCGGTKDADQSDTQAAVDMDALCKNMLAADTTLPEM